jgi:TP901 family phage tail tape measure protein
MTTSEVAKLSVYFFRQGRAAKDALELTKVAAIASRVAAIDATESANYLTSAINGFGLAASEAMAVSDRFAALGASSASSYEEMAIALSKVAPVAKLSGVGIDFMMGVIAKGIETTREAPENIGTAFKTIFARMTQIRDFGATLDDSVGVNTVEEALAQAEVALRDSTGNFRDMEDVLEELGYKFNSLTRNQQTYIATALAGTRQQSRLLAVMQNFDRTMELVNVSLGASGATLAQQAEYSDGLEAAMARLNNAFQKLVLSVSNSEAIVNFVNFFGNAINAVADEFEINGDRIAIAAGILGTVLVAALIKVKIATYAVKHAITAKAAAITIATGGLNLIIPVLVAVAAALVTYFGFLRRAETAEQKFAKESKKLSEAIKENQVALYNFTKQSNDINKLKKRYTELNKQVIKTTEEMEEMESLGAQIKKLAAEEYGIILEVDATVTDTAQLILDQLEKQTKATLQENITLGQDRINLANEFVASTGQAFSNMPGFDAASDLSAMTNALASNLFGRDNFINAGVEQQERMIEIAGNNLGLYIAEQARALKAYQAQQKIISDFDTARTTITNRISQLKPVIFSTADQGNFNLMKSLFNNQARGTGLSISDDQFDMFKQFSDEMDAQGIQKTSTEYINRFIQSLQTSALTELGDQNLGSIFSDFMNIDGEEILGFVDRFEDMLKNKLSKTEVDTLFAEFFTLGETARQSILNNVEELKALSQLSMSAVQDILQKGITDVEGRQLMAGELIEIATILSDNDLSQKEIEDFFAGLESFTVAGINGFLDTIDDQVQKSALEEDFFNYITKNASPQEFMNNIEKSKNSVRTLLDLQQKYIEEGLSAEEFGIVRESLGSGPLLEDFFAGSLTAQAIAGTQVDQFKKDIAEAIAFTNERIENVGEDGPPGALMSLKNDLLMYERIMADIDFLVFDAGMEEFYETQKQQIEEINVRLQEQLELEQKKLDMNRSMLSLNRQIAALERDTSFGAQARLEDLRLTRSQEAAQREAFILETMANQQLEGLPDEVQSEIKTNTARTANGIAELVRLFGGKSSDFKVIETSTGNSVGGGGTTGGGGTFTALASN